MFGFLKKKPVSIDDNATLPQVEKDPVHIKIRNIHKAFGENKEHKVLQGVDLDLYRGKINIIIGGSGQGKSVLLKHVIALLVPDEGNIYIDGFDVVGKNEFELQPIRKRFGMLFQYAALFDSMSVLDNVAFPMREHTKMSEKEIKERVYYKLKQLQLEQALNKFPAELSGGMKKRVALARALALNPEIIIYDEPTTGLDPVLTKEVDTLILETAQREKVTSLVISHDMASTFRVGDFVAMLYQGKIVAQGHPRDLRGADQHPALREFLEVAKVKL
jgi:phospholipid/cholesterol/gamma-HCH transport system ATP-binding protein